MKGCPSCGEENADRARFCQRCGTALPDAEGPSGEVRKVVTIVFADVTGSTALGERLDPEALRRVMSRFFDEMAAVIERHEGTVEKFIGDAVMAVFGIPRLHEDDPLRAVRAAAGLNAALDELNAELERDHGVGLAARIGVNTGEVVAGDSSTGQRLVTGDAVNVAARLEQAAAPGEVLLGEATYQLVRDAVEVELVAPLELKGKSAPVAAYRLRTVREAGEGHARHLDSPMVGRKKELDLLHHALERATSERTANLFTLLGPAGVGKSRLVLELLAGPAAGANVLRGRCLSYGEGITFYPVAEAVQRAAGVGRTDDVEAARTKLAALLEGSEERDRIVSLVGGLLSWNEPGPTEDAFWAVRKLFEHLARERPLVVVFDDVHWAEPTLLDLVEHVADWTRDAAVLLVCVARPELLDDRPGWGGGKMNATSILLEPLDATTASSLVDNLLGSAEIPQAARARILEAAEGNPLFVEEMLAMLIDDGLLRFEDGTWRAAADLADLTVPPTIQLLLAARIDRLDAEERAVMERGAVEGKVFHSGAVATLASDVLRPKVPSRLLALARKELIRPDRAEFAGEDAFRFRHLLIRDAAYQAMPKEQRADLHERFAAWLEGVAGDRLPEYEEILAHHLEQAYRYRLELGAPDDRSRALGAAAAERLVRAAERSDPAAAVALLRRAVAMSEGPLRAQALLELARTLEHLTEFADAIRAAEDAMALAEALGMPSLALRARLVTAPARVQIDPGYPQSSAMTQIEAALDGLRKYGDEKGILEGTLAAAQAAFYFGRCEQSREMALGLADRVATLAFHDRHRLMVHLVVPVYFGPMPAADALIELERVRALAPESLVHDAETGNLRAALLGMLGREQEMQAEIVRVERIWQEIGDTGMAITRFQFFGDAYRSVGWADQAERTLRTGAERLTAAGETGWNSTQHALIALTLCELGRFDEAEVEAGRARALSAEDDFASQCEWREAQAQVLSHRREHGAALALVDEAIAIMEPTDYLPMQAECREVRAGVLAAMGRLDDARTEYRLALGLVERKGVVLAVERVRARLAELPATSG